MWRKKFNVLKDIDKRFKTFLYWFLHYVSTGRRFKGKGKGNKTAQTGSAKGKVQFQGKKTKFDSDEEHDENRASGKFFFLIF